MICQAHSLWTLAIQRTSHCRAALYKASRVRIHVSWKIKASLKIIPAIASQNIILYMSIGNMFFVQYVPAPHSIYPRDM